MIQQEHNMQVRVKEQQEEFGRCGCGRSPIGKCIGWHGLSESEFQSKLVDFLTEEQRKEEDFNNGAGI
jgi:hypothetical protein